MFEAYKVAVKLSLINNVSSGLIHLAGQFQSLNSHVGSTQKGLTGLKRELLEIKKLGLIGGAMTATGALGLSMFKGPLEEASRFQLEVARFEALGLGAKMNKDAVEFAKGMKTYGTSMTENMVLFRDAQTVFRDSGNLHHAEMVTPLLAKMKFANETLYGSERGGEIEGKFMDMLRVIEMRRGLNSPDEFRKQANMIQQVLTTSGGRVDATQYLSLIKTGGVAAKGLSNQAMYYQLEPLMQEMGGMRVGTGLMSAYQNMVLGRTTVQVAKELNRLGLLDSKHIEYNKIGMIKRILPGGLKNSDMLESSPVDFLEKTLLPAFRAKGITSEQDTLRELGLVFSNRTASQLFSTMYLQLAQIRKGEQMSAGAMNIDQADAKARSIADGKLIELQKKWRDVLNELGTVVLPYAIKGVEWLTSALKRTIAFAHEYPGLTKALTLGFAAISGLLSIGGSILMAISGFRALRLVLGLLSGTVGTGGAAGGTGGGLLGSLGGLGRGLGVVARAFGTLSIALAPFLAMRAVTNWVADTSHDKERIGTLKGWSDKIRSFLPSWFDHTKASRERYDARRAELNPSADEYVRPAAAGKPQAINNTIVMPNGQVLAKVVTEVQSREAQRPSSAIGRPDGRMSLAPVGATGR